MAKIYLSIDYWLYEKEQRTKGNRKNCWSLENSKCVANSRSVETTIYIEDYLDRQTNLSLKRNLKTCVYWAHHWSLKTSFRRKKAAIKL